MKKNTLLFSIFILAMGTRLIPHPPNFTAIGALALFAGASLEKKSYWWAPFLVLLTTDLYLGFHSTMFFVYGAFGLISLLGSWIGEQEKISKNSVMLWMGSSLFSSLLFFFVTNFGVWWVGGYYTEDLQGLMDCFIMALPFLKFQVGGDLFYGSIFFLGFYLMRREGWILPLKPQRVHSER